jgi:CubicO group peptidase (beta-lactamase class C family)
MIAETVTGTSIGTLLRRRVFMPRGLGHTTYPTSSQILGPHVHGYLAEQPLPVDISALSPTSSPRLERSCRTPTTSPASTARCYADA